MFVKKILQEVVTQLNSRKHDFSKHFAFFPSIALRETRLIFYYGTCFLVSLQLDRCKWKKKKKKQGKRLK